MNPYRKSSKNTKVATEAVKAKFTKIPFVLKLSKKSITVGMVAVVTLIISACGSPPKREPYSGADLVGGLTPAQITGQWKVTVLNPIAEENKSQIYYNFSDSGAWQTTFIPSDDQTKSLGKMEFRGQGVWNVDGDKVFSKTETVKEITGNKLGGIMQSIINTSLSKSAGFVNPYEVSANRIIWVHEDTGQASLLERI